jgi:hypothetical protein
MFDVRNKTHSSMDVLVSKPIAIPKFKNIVWDKLERMSVAVKFGRSL